MLSVAKWGLGTHTFDSKSSVLLQYGESDLLHPVQPFPGVHLETRKQPFPQLQPVNLCCPSWPQPASKISLVLSSNHIDPLQFLQESFVPASGPCLKVFALVLFFFLNPKPSFPHLGKSDIFLTDEVSTWKSSTVERKSSQDWESTTQTVINPDEASSKISRNQYFSGPRCTCKTTSTTYLSKWLCLLTNCLFQPTFVLATFWIKMAHSPPY